MCFDHNVLCSGTFDVQHCDVHTDHTSYILVECTFAINSTAPGFVLIQDEHSQYTINTTLQRHEGDVSKGSVNITDLPTGEYRVTVYDEMEDYWHEIKHAYNNGVFILKVTLPVSLHLPKSFDIVHEGGKILFLYSMKVRSHFLFILP